VTGSSAGGTGRKKTDALALSGSDTLGSFELRQRAVKRAHRHMPRFARDLKHQTIGKSQRGPVPIVNQSFNDDFRILNRQVTMFEQKIHGPCKSRGIAIVNGPAAAI
jgi:hypothetical protein